MGPLDNVISECLLFHGTSREAAGSIAEKDFQLPRQHAHGGLYGKGIYLAESSTKAHMYCTEDNKKFPFLIVRAALGDILVVKEDRPNARKLETDAGKASEDRYDTVCGDRRHLKHNFSGWREFIVYEPCQVLTEWIVWCKVK